jgi:hypothetical protein
VVVVRKSEEVRAEGNIAAGPVVGA